MTFVNKGGIVKRKFFLYMAVFGTFICVGWRNGAVKHWKNWAGNQRCTATIVTPHTIQELQAAIQQAKKENKTIRPYGSSHSWSDIVCTDDYLINTDKLNKIVSIDHEKKHVTVQAGIKLKHLNKELAKIGLCLANQSAITEQSLAGVISTATHGSGKTGTFASFITRVKLVTADGSVLTLSETENPELFGAARTSIGSLGILAELTVHCEPLFKVRYETKTSTWTAMMNEYQQWLRDNDFMQFYWNVADDSVHITIHNRVNDDGTATHKESFIQKVKNVLPFKEVDYSYKMLSGRLAVAYMEEEIAIPITNFIPAAQAARELVRKEYQKSHMFSDILFRFVSAEKNNYLSPAADQDVVFFSITTSSMRGYEPFYKEFYNLMLTYGGRPHWGKINYLTHDDAAKLYGDKFNQFISVRKKLDPDGVFSNEFTKRVFGW